MLEMVWRKGNFYPVGGNACGVAPLKNGMEAP